MKDEFAQLGHAFWQFEIAGVTLPHLKVRGRVGRREGEYWLKVWGERLLFCAADAPEKVFAVVTPYKGEHDLAEFWRASVQRGDYGRLSSDAHEMERPAGWASFAVLKANNGRSWARDWCGGDWIEFVGPKFPADLSQVFLRYQNTMPCSSYGAALSLNQNDWCNLCFGYAVRVANGSRFYKRVRPCTFTKIRRIVQTRV